MDMACRIHGRDKKIIQILVIKRERKKPRVDEHDVDGNGIIKTNTKRTMCEHTEWLHLAHEEIRDGEPLGSTKSEKFIDNLGVH